jgi:hypothetical protein
VPTDCPLSAAEASEALPPKPGSAFLSLGGPAALTEAYSSDVDYPPGEVENGIQWSPKFTDLQISISNTTGYDYSQLDLLIKPKEPVIERRRAAGGSGRTRRHLHLWHGPRASWK